MEFQIRREVLKQFGINQMADLVAKAGGLWTYLTGHWFSLRLPDDSNVSRRTIHPWWQAVEAMADQFGSVCEVTRDFSPQLASVEWYISHCSGCLAGYAARRNLRDLESAVASLMDDMRNYYRGKDFSELLAVKSILLGKPAPPPSNAGGGPAGRCGAL